MKKFLNTLLPILILAFTLFSCEKNGDDPVNPPDPPGKIYKSEITITFTIPENVDLYVREFHFCDAAGNSVIGNLKDYVIIPKFTYTVDTALARQYLGKQVKLYLGGGRVVNNQSYGTDNWVTIDQLKEKNDVNINIEYPL